MIESILGLPSAFNIQTDGSQFNSIAYVEDQEVVVSERIQDLILFSGHPFLSVSDDFYLKIFRSIESFVFQDKNWDGYDALPLTQEVADKAKMIIGKIDSKFLTESIVDIEVKNTPYSTLVIDWFNEFGELSLEIGKDTLGYFTESNKLNKEVTSLNISSEESVYDVIKAIETDLEEIFKIN